jgi:hypothetical protein
VTPAAAVKLTWPDLAPPLDLTVNYSRTAALAQVRQQFPDRRVSPRGRRDDADELVPFWTAPAGYCRVCGEPCETRRHRWHEDCVARYNALASSQGFRTAVWDRDRGVCAACPPGTPAQPRFNGERCSCGATWRCERPYVLARVPELRARQQAAHDAWEPDLHRPIPYGWDADHIVPLVDGGPNTMENAQTLCLPHHRSKTAAEARARAALRRGALRIC